MNVLPDPEGDHEDPGAALRRTFPAMPHGRNVLFGALVDAAALDVEGRPSRPEPGDGAAVQRQADSALPR